MSLPIARSLIGVGSTFVLASAAAGAPPQGCTGVPPLAVMDGCVCPTPSFVVSWGGSTAIDVLVNDIPGSGTLDPSSSATVDPVSQPPQGFPSWNGSFNCNGPQGVLMFCHSSVENLCAEFGVGTYRLLDSCGVSSNEAAYAFYIPATAGDCNCNCDPTDAPLDDNSNLVDDRCEIASTPFLDCNGNGWIDDTEFLFDDCNHNGRRDSEDLADPLNPSADADGDAIPDECQDGAVAATTELASHGALLAPLTSVAILPSLSTTGRYVAFATAAAVTPAVTPNGMLQLYLLDRASGAMRGVSVAPASGVAGNGNCAESALSRDESKLVFSSRATNLVAGDPTSAYDIYFLDLSTGVLQLISKRAGQAIHGDCRMPTISANGDFVAFTSSSDLVAGDTNGVSDAFVWSRASGTLARVSVTSGGAQLSAAVTRAALSRSGAKVAFVTAANGVVPGDSNSSSDVFLCDRLQPSNVQLVSRALVGGAAVGGCHDSSLSITALGEAVAFASSSSALVASDTNGVDDVFVRNVVQGVTTRVSVDGAGAQANGPSTSPELSGDGRRVAFTSSAANLAPSWVGAATPHAYRRDLVAGTTAFVARNSASSPTTGSLAGMAMSGDGRSVAFVTDGVGMLPGVPSLHRVYVRDFGPRNRALKLDGSNWARIEKKPCQEFLGPFTLEFWVQPEALGFEQTVLSKWADGERSYEVGIDAAGAVSFLMSRSDTQDDVAFQSFTAGQLAAGEWSHVACTFDGSTRRIFVNGVLAGEKATSGFPHPSRFGLTLGGRSAAPFQPPTRRLVGWVDELRLWRAARPLGQIQQWMNAPLRRPRIFDHPTLVAAFGFEYVFRGQSALFSPRDERFYNELTAFGALQYDWADDRPKLEVDCDGDGVPDWLEIQNQTALDSDGDGVPDECDCQITRYCVGAPNSAGGGAALGASGSSSILANDLALSASGCPPNVPGIFYMGPSAVQAPLGNGFRCVSGQIGRFGFSHTNAVGVASLSLDNQSFPGGVSPVPGDVRNFQFWYRDTAAGGAGTNLTDALRIEFCQ